MIVALPGWRGALSGDDVLLELAAEPSAAIVRYRERVRPLRPMREVAAPRARALGVEVPAIERVITLEGEYGAVCHIEGRRDGAPHLTSLGMVFGDDFYSELVGASQTPARFGEVRAAVRRLVELDTHALGERRRRFVYAPPAGWDCFPQLFHSVWVPPGYPRVASQLAVYPAIPGPEGYGASIAASMVAGPLPAPRRFAARGLAWDLDDRTLVALEDGRHVYLLDAAGAPARDVLGAVVASIELLPQARRPAAAAQVAGMYAE